MTVLYEFEEGAGTTLRDTSGNGAPLDLGILSPSTVTWQSGSLLLANESEIVSSNSATKISQACKQSGEITVEAWVTPTTVEQGGPARIVTLSDGLNRRNVTLAHGRFNAPWPTVYGVNARTTATSENGVPGLITGANEVPGNLHHVVFTRQSDGLANIYVDGTIRASGTMAGDLLRWDESFRLGLGNEIGASRPWLGSLHLVAIYERALTTAEVLHNLRAGSGDRVGGSIDVLPKAEFVVHGRARENLGDHWMDYQVSNRGNLPISWSVSSSRSWVYIDGPSAGTLSPGQSVSPTVRLHAWNASKLRAGFHQAEILWTNQTNGIGNVEVHAQLTLTDPTSSIGKPGPHNTGPSDPGLLVPSGPITASTNGQVIENVDVAGPIAIAADNVTIRNFRINALGASYGIYGLQAGHTGIVIEDGEIMNTSSTGLLGSNFTARRLNIHESGKDGVKARGDVLVENCWIHHLGTMAGAHADGNQTRMGSNIVFRHNNLDMPVPESPNGTTGYRSNAAFMINSSLGATDNFLIEGNWLNGGNYTVFLDADHGPITNVRIIGNRFGRDYRYGTALLGAGAPVIASGNVWDDTGELLPWNNR